MKRLIILVLPCLLSLQHLSAQTAKSNQIHDLVSELFNQKLFNGAVVVGERGRVIYSQGFGYANFETGMPFTPQTPGDGGSIAKTMTATAILLLKEQGKLSLDDPVGKYLAGYPYEGTQVKNLISHSTGGLPDYDYYFKYADETSCLSNERIAAVLANEYPALLLAPGSDFIYDSPGFDLAALVVEKVTDMPFSDFLSQYFFEPFAMNTAFVRPCHLDSWPQPRTVGYRYVQDTLRLFDITDREGFYGGSNIWVSAEDLYKWGNAFYRQPGLGESLKEECIRPVLINGKLSYIVQGAWYRGRHNGAYYYWGSLYGFYCFVYWDRENQFTIAFINNTDMPQALRPRFSGALISILEGKAYVPVKRPDRAKINPARFEAITGSYKVKHIGQIGISMQEGLSLKAPNGLSYRMYLVDKETFYVPGIECWISFGKEKKQHFRKIYWESPNLITQGKRFATS